MKDQNNKIITRNDFMNFFRDDECLNTLSPDDRIEIFSTILLGSSDFTKKLFDDLFSDYCITHLEVIEIEECQEKIGQENKQ